MELSGRNALVLGLGISGLSMARWLSRRGARVRVADTRPTPPCAAQLARELPEIPVHTGPFTGDLLRDADLVALSPGTAQSEPPIAQAARRGVPVVGDVELFAQAQFQNIFNQFQVFNGTAGQINTTVRTFITDPRPLSDPARMQPFDPFTETPVEGVHWERGPLFGQPLSASAYTVPRDVRFSVGFRF